MLNFYFSGLVYENEKVVGYRSASTILPWKQQVEFAQAVLKTVDIENTITHLMAVWANDMGKYKVSATIQNGEVVFSDGEQYNPNDFTYINFYF